MFLKYLDAPEEAIIKPANMVGSDTDTIANFVGSLVGCYLGMNVNSHLLKLSRQVQDSEYIKKLAENLWSVYKGNVDKNLDKKISREDSYLKLRIWKEDLEYIMKRENNKGKTLIHPTFGKGKIEKEIIKPIPMKQDYIAKILKVKFDCQVFLFPLCPPFILLCFLIICYFSFQMQESYCHQVFQILCNLLNQVL